MDKKLLGLKEAMKYTGFSRASIIKYVNEGLLSYINVGEGEILIRYKFKVTELDKLIDNLLIKHD